MAVNYHLDAMPNALSNDQGDRFLPPYTVGDISGNTAITFEQFVRDYKDLFI